MGAKFKVGDYVYAEDWIYGKIVNIDGKYAEVDFDTMHGGGSLTFELEDLKHAEPPKRKINLGDEK